MRRLFNTATLWLHLVTIRSEPRIVSMLAYLAGAAFHALFIWKAGVENRKKCWSATP